MCFGMNTSHMQTMDITVKTKHGGIITIEKMLDGKWQQ